MSNYLLYYCKDVPLEELLGHLQSRLQRALSRQPRDLDFLKFFCNYELFLIQSFTGQTHTDNEILQHLNNLLELVQVAINSNPTVSHVETAVGLRGNQDGLFREISLLDCYKNPDAQCRVQECEGAVAVGTMGEE